MARDLRNATGIGADTNFLNGNLVDNQTEINEFIYQDIVQFFQKLMADAELTPNDLADNEANDYQFVEALNKKINDEVPIATEDIEGKIKLATKAETLLGYNSTKAISPATLNDKIPLIQKTGTSFSWDMDTNANYSIDLYSGLGISWNDIVRVSLLIEDDSRTNAYILEQNGGGVEVMNNTYGIKFYRTTGSVFDSSNFSNARCTLTVDYTN